MSVIALASPKGSPGTTTASLALASVWPGTAAVADLDPVGGDVIWRARTPDGSPLDPDRGLLSLAVGVRRGASETRLAEHLQTAAGGDVLVGVRSPEQLAGLGGAWSQLPEVFSAHDTDVLVDCGRLVKTSPAMAVVQRADAVCLVVRPDLEGSAHLRERLRTLVDPLDLGRPGGTPVGVVLVTSYRDSAVVADMQQLLDHEGLGARVLGILATDPKSAAAFASRRSVPRTSLLTRSAVTLAEELRQLVDSRTSLRVGS